MTEDDIIIVDTPIRYFARNKDQRQLSLILQANLERCIILNTRHNIVQISYFTGKYTKNNKYEVHTFDKFGASYEVLDALFDKYKDKKPILDILVKFCLHSKCKSYWNYKLKNSELGTKIMAAILGGRTDETA